MKKKLIVLISVVLIGTIFWSVKSKVKKSGKEKLQLFSNFTADLHFTMVSNGTFMGNEDHGLKIETQLEGNPSITFDKAAGLIKVSWTPILILKVNDVLKEDYKKYFDSVKDEIFYIHFNKQMIIDNIYYSKRSDIPSEVQELVLNFDKMLAHQVVWYFVLAPQEKKTIVKGVDIWGENNQNIKHENGNIVVLTNSIPEKSTQIGNGEFTLIREDDGKVSSSGEQNSTMGDVHNPMAKTTNIYKTETINYNETPEQNLKVELTLFEKTPPWIVVDSLALKTATLKNKLKDWDKDKLQTAVFKFKLKKNGSYKDIAEISTLITDMLFLDHSLANSYYDWLKKLGLRNPLYDEFLKAFNVVGCEDCQKFLVQITQDYKKDVSASQKSLLAIGFLENPNEASELALRDLSLEKNFVNHDLAAFMVGNMAAQLAESDPIRAQKIDSDFSKKLKKSNNRADLTRNLTALGNSGLCTDYISIEKLAYHSDEFIRKDAVLALRDCKNENVPKLYQVLYKNDKNLRATILQASEMRLQKGIVEEEQFDYFKNLFEAQLTNDEGERRQILSYLKIFSSIGDSYKEQLEELQKACEKTLSCSYFK